MRADETRRGRGQDAAASDPDSGPDLVDPVPP
jgi:hypothetical protein